MLNCQFPTVTTRWRANTRTALRSASVWGMFRVIELSLKLMCDVIWWYDMALLYLCRLYHVFTMYCVFVLFLLTSTWSSQSHVGCWVIGSSSSMSSVTVTQPCDMEAHSQHQLVNQRLLGELGMIRSQSWDVMGHTERWIKISCTNFSHHFSRPGIRYYAILYKDVRQIKGEESIEILYLSKGINTQCKNTPLQVKALHAKLYSQVKVLFMQEKLPLWVLH